MTICRSIAAIYKKLRFFYQEKSIEMTYEVARYLTERLLTMHSLEESSIASVKISSRKKISARI